MDIKWHQLQRTLQTRFPKVMLISGDEPILMQQSTDTFIEEAKKQGISHHERYDVEDDFQWENLQTQLAQQNLFAEKSLIQIINRPTQFNKKTADIIKKCLKQLPPHQYLLIRCGKLSPAQSKSAWYLQLRQQGVSLRIWPLQVKEVQSWLQHQLATYHIKLKPALARELMLLTQNNLTDMWQAIEKLRLLDENIEINHALLTQILTCHLQFNVFSLSDAILDANLERVLAYCQSINPHENKDLILIVWGLRQMLNMIKQQHAKLNPSRHYATAARIEKAAPRFLPQTLQNDLQQLAELDKRLKGCQLKPPLNTQQCWLRIYSLLIDMCQRHPKHHIKGAIL